jgi:ABC-type nitrate/sulfonate/bicarbonate transport system substrate-binding protein
MSAAPTTLWTTRCPIPTALGIALGQGWVAEALAPLGLDVRSLATSPDRTVREAHWRHDQPGQTRQGGNIPPLVARSRGIDVRLIGFSWPRTSHPVLASAVSGISRAEDLRGRRLSVPRRVDAPVDFWRPTVLRAYAAALASAGLTFGDVELVDVVVDRSFLDGSATGNVSLFGARGQLGFQREEAVALIGGDVDALVSEAGFSVLMRYSLGLRVVVDVEALEDPRQRVNNGIPLALTVSGDLLDHRPDVVAELLAQVDRAGAWAAGNERDAKRIFAGEASLPEELVVDAFGAQAHRDLDVVVDDAGLDALRAQHAFLLEHGVLEGPVDLDAYVAADVRAAARVVA